MEKHIDERFIINGWSDVEPTLKELLERKIDSQEDLMKLIADYGTFLENFEEEFGWSYINMTRDVANEEYQKRYAMFNSDILPHFMKINSQITSRISELSKNGIEDKFKLMIKRINTQNELFREKNIPLKTRLTELSTAYSSIMGRMSVNIDGEELTMPMAAKLLKDKDRDIRKKAFLAIKDVRLASKEEVDSILSEMIKLRTEEAENAGFENYRDYRFKELERFDYGVDESKLFHRSVANVCMDYFREIYENKKELLNVEVLKPYDVNATSTTDVLLKPFDTSAEFVEKSKEVFYKTGKIFGDVLKMVDDAGKLDLESRKGKAPGGYNYPLYRTGLPFIFMNSAQMHNDMRTLMHEGGHAVHTYAVKNMFTYFYKNTPSEVAELASMSMELLTMDHWNIFYPDAAALKQAKREQLEGIITFLPWCAAIDRFQHWLYENKAHSAEERESFWIENASLYGDRYVDWSKCPDYHKITWQRQIHIFEVPFYYIEYGIAQLGALQVWKNYLEDGPKAVDSYFKALSLGSSLSIPEIYKTAGIDFDFSEKKISELMQFTYDIYKELI